MSEKADLSGVEDILRRVQPPSEVPERYRRLAADAALGHDTVEAGATRVRRASWWRRPQFVAVAGAFACVVVALVAVSLGSGGTGGSHTTIALAGQSPNFASATGELKLASSSGAMRDAVLTVRDLPPAPQGSYYEMWMQSGSESVGIMAFDTDSSGSMTVRTAIPSGMPWTRCWVSLEDESQPGSAPQSVLKSS